MNGKKKIKDLVGPAVFSVIPYRVVQFNERTIRWNIRDRLVEIMNMFVVWKVWLYALQNVSNRVYCCRCERKIFFRNFSENAVNYMLRNNTAIKSSILYIRTFTRPKMVVYWLIKCDNLDNEMGVTIPAKT